MSQAPSRILSGNQFPRKNRIPTSLNRKLDRKLVGYTVAATAAGVGLMVTSQTSEAEIVYTPLHQTVSPGQVVALDLNGDGITDFNLDNFYFTAAAAKGRQGGVFPTNGSYTEGLLQVIPVRPNHVLVNSASLASALTTGQRVGRTGKWDQKFGDMAVCDSLSGSVFRSFGLWRNVESKYLGLEFSIEGQVHFGWARLSVTQTKCQFTAVLTGYAYETIAGKAIPAGKMSGADQVSDHNVSENVGPGERFGATLGNLALGSTGLLAWRRDADPD